MGAPTAPAALCGKMIDAQSISQHDTPPGTDTKATSALRFLSCAWCWKPIGVLVMLQAYVDVYDCADGSVKFIRVTQIT
jgi:hypothetical protein